MDGVGRDPDGVQCAGCRCTARRRPCRQQLHDDGEEQQTKADQPGTGATARPPLIVLPGPQHLVQSLVLVAKPQLPSEKDAGLAQTPYADRPVTGVTVAAEVPP